jgi:hypothetical protein
MAGPPDEPSIERLPEIVARLPNDLRSLFDSLYSVHRHEGRIEIPPEMIPWVEERLGVVADIQTQQIVRVRDRYTLEATTFNALRARRPLTIQDGAGGTASVPLNADDDPLADPLAMTPNNTVERVRGRACVTAANVAMADAWHALVVFDEPDPLRFSAEDVEDYLSTALRWANRVHDHDAEAVYPFIFWNAAWRAGASLQHGHAQVLVAKEEPYARVGALRDAAQRFQADTGHDYFQTLSALHEALGLDFGASGIAAFAHLTAVKEKEIVLIGESLGLDFFRAVGRVLVAFRDSLAVESFNVAVFGPPLGDADASWERFPAIARIVDRGALRVQTSDIAGMELFAQSVVTADPFRVAEALRRGMA